MTNMIRDNEFSGSAAVFRQRLDTVGPELLAAVLQVHRPNRCKHAATELAFAFDSDDSRVRQLAIGIRFELDSFFEIQQIELQLVWPIPVGARSDDRVQQCTFSRPCLAGDQDMLSDAFAERETERTVAALAADDNLDSLVRIAFSFLAQTSE